MGRRTALVQVGHDQRCGRGPEEMARSGWVPGELLAGKLNVCVISGVEDHPSSHQGPMLFPPPRLLFHLLLI